MKNSATTETVHRATHSDLYQEITDKIIAMIEKGVAPWRQTWSSYGLARNFATGHIYTGINFLLMNNSKEELVAEMGASFLCSHSQIDYDSIVENNASYLAGWLKVMKEDPKFIFQVSAEAQKAVNYVYNLNPEL